jgi:hypothetical protein
MRIVGAYVAAVTVQEHGRHTVVVFDLGSLAGRTNVATGEVK